MAQVLLEFESVTGHEVYELIREITGKDLEPEDKHPASGPPPEAPTAVATPDEPAADDATGTMEPAPATRSSEPLENR